MEILVKKDSLPNAYKSALYQLSSYGEEVDCSDWGTKCIECSMTMEIEEPDKEPKISAIAFVTPESLTNYLGEMLEGTLDWAIEAGKEPYTYHDRMVRYNGVNQIEYVINELHRNHSSRRAIILIRHSDDFKIDDQACLQHIQFFIRNNKLNCIATFRSNDAVKATFMNAYALIELQKKILKMLNEKGHEYVLGTYTHRANSFHAYERDWPILKRIAERVATNTDFEDFYTEEFME